MVPNFVVEKLLLHLPWLLRVQVGFRKHLDEKCQLVDQYFSSNFFVG